jgi:hypothetical protein
MKLINGHKAWSEKDEAELLQLMYARTPMRLMRARLGRTAAAIHGRLKRITMKRVTPLVVLSVND